MTEGAPIPVIDTHKAAVQPGAGPRARVILYLVWLALALFLAVHHVVWRDEVRALTFALSGDTVGAMLRNLHGEGHPALWYLLLRGAHALWPHPQVLVVTAFLVGAAASLIFTMRAPFAWPLLALGLFGRFALYEYTVMARNYGISMLILYLLAWAYPRYRDNGWVIGGLLLLLCNTNFPAAILAAAFLLYWAIDLHCQAPGRWDRRWLALGLGTGLALIGAMLCAATVYVPLQDATNVAAITRPGLLETLASSGHYFDALVPQPIQGIAALILPILLIGIFWNMRDNPGALIAGLTATLGLLVVFAFLYSGAYRHQALLTVFLLTLAWLREEGFGGGRTREDSGLVARISPVAKLALPALLLFQTLSSVPLVTRPFHDMPESRSYELARLLRRPDLHGAIVIGDPDYVLESLPYYVANPLYLVREHRWGQTTRFTKAARRTVIVDELLDTARRLHADTGKKIVILLGDRDPPDGKPVSRGGFGDFIVTPEGLARLRAATQPLASFNHVTAGDESYDVLLYPANGSPNPPLAPAPTRRYVATAPGPEECSSVGRASVSKTEGRGFESLHSCHSFGKARAGLQVRGEV